MALDELEMARQEIAQIYFAAFNRIPDEGGLQNWLNQYTAGLMDYADISEDFSHQTEYLATYPADQTNQEYITEIYHNVFGRAPDADGLQNWINQLDYSSITGFNKGNIMSAMLDSAGAVGNTDGMRLDNKAKVAIQLIDNGITDATFVENAMASITHDVSTLDIVTNLVEMATESSEALAEISDTLAAVKELIIANEGDATASAAVLANLAVVIENVATSNESAAITDLSLTLSALTTTVEAAIEDPTFVANPETLATSIATDPTAVEEDATAVVEEATTPTTPSTGGGGSSTPAATTQTVSVSADGSSSASSLDSTYNFSAGTYTYTITGFNDGDVLNFPDQVAPTIINTNLTDGAVTAQWAYDGNVITANLTIPTADDASIYGVTSFNTAFGSGAIVATPAVAPSSSVDVAGANSSYDASTLNTTFHFAAGTYTYTIAGFNDGDVLDFPDGMTPTVINTNFTDGNLTLQWANSGSVITANLTGISTTDDGGIYGVTSFNTAFGSGSIA